MTSQEYIIKATSALNSDGALNFSKLAQNEALLELGRGNPHVIVALEDGTPIDKTDLRAKLESSCDFLLQVLGCGDCKLRHQNRGIGGNFPETVNVFSHSVSLKPGEGERKLEVCTNPCPVIRGLLGDDVLNNDESFRTLEEDGDRAAIIYRVFKLYGQLAACAKTRDVNLF